MSVPGYRGVPVANPVRVNGVGIDSSVMEEAFPSARFDALRSLRTREAGCVIATRC